MFYNLNIANCKLRTRLRAMLFYDAHNVPDSNSLLSSSVFREVFPIDPTDRQKEPEYSYKTNSNHKYLMFPYAIKEW